MNYAPWLKSVPDSITNDSLWKMAAYRLSLFLSDVAWTAVTKLTGDIRTRSLADQLFRAVGSISANVAEGYSRGTGRDRARFYEYALGSARETRDWYFKARHVLGPCVTEHRLNFLAEIIRLLLTMVPQQRGMALKEDDVRHRVQGELQELSDEVSLGRLLQDIPLPDE
jgi:four helix bundle protein